MREPTSGATLQRLSLVTGSGVFGVVGLRRMTGRLAKLPGLPRLADPLEIPVPLKLPGGKLLRITVLGMEFLGSEFLGSEFLELELVEFPGPPGPPAIPEPSELPGPARLLEASDLDGLPASCRSRLVSSVDLSLVSSLALLGLPSGPELIASDGLSTFLPLLCGLA